MFRVDYKIIIITHKAIHGTAPNYLSSLVDLKPNSNYSLRSNNKYLLSKVPKVAVTHMIRELSW